MSKRINALMVPPGEKPCEVELLDDPTFLGLAVSIGALEVNSASWLTLEGNVGIVYNADGPLWDLKGNRRIGRKILAGIFYIVAGKDGELISLTEKQIEHYFSKFFIPEEIPDGEASAAYFRELEAEFSELLNRFM